MIEFNVKKLSDYPNKYAEVIKLIEKSFNYPEKYHYSHDFYLQFKNENLQNCFFIEINNKVIAHIGFLPLIFKLKNVSYKINFIGSIAVDNNHRKQGVFKFLFEYTLHLFKGTSALNILWSDKDKLFQKFNFYQCGEVYQTGKIDLNFLTNKNLSQLNQEEIETICHLYDNYSSNFFAPKRTITSFKDLQKISSCNIKLFKHENKIIGYMLFNKGGDLHNIIHEFVITPKYYDQLLEKYSKYKIWLPVQTNINNTLMYSAILNINDVLQFEALYLAITDNKLNNNKSPQEILQNLFGPNNFKKNNFPLWIPGVNSI